MGDLVSVRIFLNLFMHMCVYALYFSLDAICFFLPTEQA